MKMKNTFRLVFLMTIFGYLACTPKLANDNKKKTISEVSSSVLIKADKTKADVPDESSKRLLNEKIPFDPSVRTGILDNGMAYFIKKNSKPENRVELRLALKAGSIVEDEDQKGLAHFIEHMEFNGSEHFTSNGLINYLEKVGTKFGPDLNAYTSFDETVYMLQVRSDVENQLDTGLLVLYDWAGKASLDSKEIDKERGVVISEWRTRLSPGQRMSQKYFPILYKGSRYAERLPIGDPEIVKNAKYETVRRFYKDWYRPDLMAVIIVGDVDVDKIEKKVKTMFSNFSNPQNEREREKYTVPAHKGTAVAIVTDKEAPFTNVRIVNKLPHIPVNTKKDLLEDMKRDLFNMMLNARLDEIKNTANPPFTFAYTGYNPNIGDIDSYSSWAMVPEGRALDALKTFAEENERVLRYGFTYTELKREKKNLLKEAERDLKERDKTESRRYASKAVYHFLKNYPMMNEDQYYNFVNLNLDKINLASVNSLAKNWIKDDNRVIIITAPDKDGVKIPTKAEVLDVLQKVKNTKIDAYKDNATSKPLFSKKLPPAPIKSESINDEYGITKLVLENGIEVYYKKTDFKNNETKFSAYSPGGTSVYSDTDYPNARFASRAVEEMGISEFDNNQLTKLLTGKDVSVSPYIYELYEGFRGSSTNEDLETMFQLINLYFTQPRNDKTAFESFVNRNKGLYGNLLKQPDYYFYYLTNKIKYGDQVRAGGIPTAEDFDKLDRNKVFQIYNERFADAGDFKFFFVGSFDENKLKALIQKYLGNLKSTGKKENWIDRNKRMKEGFITKKEYKGEAPKTFVDLTYHGDFNYNKDNEYILKSLSKILSIKLRESLREDKGGVYGVRVGGYANNEPIEKYVIHISFNSEPDKTEELIQAVYAVIDTLQTFGPDDEVMTKVTETQKQSRIKNLKENRYWLSKMKEIIQDDLDYSEISLHSLEKRINKLTKDDIKAAANKYLTKDNFFEISMYPDKKE